MKKGKLREPQLKRAVLRVPKKKIDEYIVPALGIGVDGAIIRTHKDIATAMSLCDIKVKGMELIAVNKSISNIVAMGAMPIGFEIGILLPEKTEEYVVKDIMNSLDEYARGYDLQIMGGHTQFLASVNSPVITSVAYGYVDKKYSVKDIKPDMDVVMTKWTGIEGTAILAELKEEELLTKYPRHYIDNAKRLGLYMSTIPEAKALYNQDIVAMHDVSYGGVFATLWELVQESGVGIEVYLKDIPIKQETIEVAEFFNINPYMCMGSGSQLIVTKDGAKIVDTLEAAGIHSAIIGKTTADNDKAVIIEDEKRYLTPPKGDEINKLI